jgi:hypothetical protein
VVSDLNAAIDIISMLMTVPSPEQCRGEIKEINMNTARVERDLTTEELQEFKAVMLKKDTYFNLVKLTFGFDLKTDGHWLWVDGYKNADERIWHWDWLSV